MNKLYKYILSIIFGIILYYTINNIINTFSIGIPPKRPLHFCAGYVNTNEDVDSNSDDSGYDTANGLEEYAEEPPETHGYIFQVPDGDGHPGEWHFEISDRVPDHMGGTNIYMIQIPENIASLEYLDPTFNYDGNGSINDISDINLTGNIKNMNFIE